LRLVGKCSSCGYERYSRGKIGTECERTTQDGKPCPGIVQRLEVKK